MGITVLLVVGLLAMYLRYFHDWPCKMPPPSIPMYVLPKILVEEVRDMVAGTPIREPVFTSSIPTCPIDVREVVPVPEWYVSDWVKDLPISAAEQLIITELNRYRVKWYREVSFYDMPLTDKWGAYRYDFFLPDHSLIIEYDSKHWHSSSERTHADDVKSEFCTVNHIQLIRYNTKHYYNLPTCIAGLMKELRIYKR